MKKLIYILSPIIAFFIGFFFLNISVNASAAPTPSSATLEIIQGGNNSLLYNAFSSVDILPFNNNPVQLNHIIGVASGNPFIEGAELNTLGADEYNIRKLTESEIEVLENASYNVFYDVNGHSVNLDDVYFMSYMNGMFHGSLYIDGNGNILTTDSNNTYSAFKLGLGGKLLNVSDIANIYDVIANNVIGNSYNFVSDSDLTVDSLYINFGIRFYSDTYSASYIYVPSGLIEGQTIINPNTNFNSTSPTFSFYTNDLNSVVYNNYLSVGNMPLINVYHPSSPQVVNGHSYTYEVYLSYATKQPLANTMNNFYNYSNFINSSSSMGVVFEQKNFHLVGNDFPVLQSDDDIIAFKKIVPLPSSKQLQFDDTYDYNYIKELESSLNDASSQVNELFDPSEDIDENNYPFEITVPSTAPDSSPSDMPTPDDNNNVNPNPNPNPNPEPSPSLSYDQDVQPDGESIANSLTNYGIPFVENIMNRYPFSIPWDIQKFVQRLRATPTPPAWNFDWKITVGATTYIKHFEGDLSDFNGLAELLRNLELIGFIIALCIFSYNKHF